MNIVVTGRHIDLKLNTKELAAEKVENALEIFRQTVRSARVIISLDNFVYRVEANIELTTKKKILIAEGKDKDIIIAIDILAKKLSAQMHKIKEKVEDHHQ